MGRKKNLHAPKGNGTANLYLDSVEAYQNAFLAEYASGRSWWKIVSDKPYTIFPNMARLISKGYDPGNKIRRELRLPDKQAVEVCPSCGVVHTTKRCTSTNGSKPRPPRIAIRLDKPPSAATTILEHMDREKVNELVELLKEG